MQGVNNPHEFLGSVGDGNIVVLSFGSLLGQVSGKGRIPETDVFRGIEEGVAKVAGAAFLHVRVGAGKGQLSRFVGRWRKSGILYNTRRARRDVKLFVAYGQRDCGNIQTPQ